MDFLLKLKNDNKNEYLIFQDNLKIGSAYLDISGDYTLHLNEEYSHLFFKYEFKDLEKKDIEVIQLPVDFDEYPYLDWMEKETSIWYDLKLNKISFIGRPNLFNWKNLFSLNDLLNRLEKNIKNNNNLNYEFDNLEKYLTINVPTLDVEGNIGKLHKKTLRLLEDISKRTLMELLQEKSNNSLIGSFTFPTEVQSACEQYLLYFSKFLEDLVDIESKITIASDNHKTLFTVTPNNSRDALSLIRDALNIYLGLPNATNLDLVGRGYSDVGVKQLIANIYHLKSQLLFAHAAIQMKDATIDSLQFTNLKLTSNLSKFSESNEESILGGLMSVGKFEKMGIKINLAEILRKIKRKKK